VLVPPLFAAYRQYEPVLVREFGVQYRNHFWIWLTSDGQTGMQYMTQWQGLKTVNLSPLIYTTEIIVSEHAGKYGVDMIQTHDL
jgi:hypothetical protein